MEALYQTNDQEAIQLAKSFERRKCGHIPQKNTNTKTKFKDEDKNKIKDDTTKVIEGEKADEEKKDEASQTTGNGEVKNSKKKPKKKWIEDNSTKTPGACLWKVVAVDKTINKHRYIVASQDYRLRARLRKIPAVPLIYLNRSVMILEPMSEATRLAREEMENKKLITGLNSVPNLKRKLGNDEQGSLEGESNLSEDSVPVKKIKRAKGPHPLSCLKKKKKPTPSAKESTKEKETSAESKEKKKRRRAHHKRNKDEGKAEQ